MKHGIVFISYDGVMEPLGQSQVLAYLEILSRTRRIHLISFEKPDHFIGKTDRQVVCNRIRAAGISWYPLRYHKRFSEISTCWDIARGIVLGCWLVIRHRLGIVHARSYVPSVMAIFIKRLTGAAYLFDMRGFWADERVDGGLWERNHFMFYLAKWFERRFLLEADHVVSLTYAAVTIMRQFDYLRDHALRVTVIPTCADLRRFRPSKEITQNEPFVLGYVGTAGTWYLFDKVVTAVSALLEIRPSTKFLVVNRDEHDYIRGCLLSASIPESTFEITTAPYSEMPNLIARMHASIFFIKPLFSKQASAPTKLAELLGCGIPCLTNSGVGDMADLLECEKVGVAIDSFDSLSIKQGLVELLCLCAESNISDRCVAVAQREFSLDEGVARFERVYSLLDEIH